MPVPAVYVPADDLYQPDLGKLGFIAALEGTSGGGFPVTRHVIADVGTSLARLGLWVSGRELYQPEGAQVTLREDHETKLIAGRYAEPAESSWQREVQQARVMMLFAGPRPAAPGTTDVGSARDLLTSRESLFGLLFSPSTMAAVIAAG